MARVAVVGTGAIGGAIAAAVDDAEVHELTCCLRTPAEKIVVTRHDGPRTLNARLVIDPDDVGPGDPPVDWVLLATKAYQTDAAKPWLDQLCGPGTRIAVLQNGIDHVERVQPLAPSAQILPVVVLLPAVKDGPGVIRQSRPGTLFVPSGEVGADFEALLAAADTEVRQVEDFLTTLWSKLVTNAATGAIALTGQLNGIATDPVMAEALEGLVGESLAVARAEGAKLGPDALDTMMARLGGAPDHLSSITADLMAGRPVEWEVRNAVIGRLGRKHAIATPRNDLLTALLRTASG